LLRQGAPDTDALFLNSTGSPLTNIHVHHALKQFASKAGTLREETLSAFSSTMLRKWVVTNTRDKPSPEKNKLASKMGHTRTTADRSYNVINKLQVASEAHDTVTSLMDNQESSSKDAQTHHSEDSVSIISPSENAYTEVATIYHSVVKRRAWLDEDVKKLAYVCRNEISNGNVPSRDTILRKVRSNPDTAAMLERETAERTYQKVKHMRRNYKKQ